MSTAETCLQCEAPCKGTTICDACWRELAHLCTEVPTLVTQLAITMSRQAHVGRGGDGRGGGAQHSLPLDLRASDARRDLVRTWEQIAARHGAKRHEDMTACAAWVLRHRKEVTHSPYAALTVREARCASIDTWRTVDIPLVATFAGRCPDCGYPVYLTQSRPVATCGHCRHQHDPAVLREATISTLWEHTGDAGVMVALLRYLYPTRSWRPGRIYVLVDRGHLKPVAHAADGRDIFRIRDVVDLVNRPRALARERARG